MKNMKFTTKFIVLLVIAISFSGLSAKNKDCKSNFHEGKDALSVGVGDIFTNISHTKTSEVLTALIPKIKNCYKVAGAFKDLKCKKEANAFKVKCDNLAEWYRLIIDLGRVRNELNKSKKGS